MQNSVRQLTTCMIEFSRYEWKPNTMYDLIIRDEEKKLKPMSTEINIQQNTIAEELKTRTISS